MKPGDSAEKSTGEPEAQDAEEATSSDEPQTLEEVFERWEARWKPAPGFVSLREAHNRWEGLGIQQPLAELLCHVPAIGCHMHGPGGQLHPDFAMDTQKRWVVNLDGNWARESKYPETAQYRVQVQCDERALDAVLEQALAAERGPAPPTEYPHLADELASIPSHAHPRHAQLRFSATDDLLDRPHGEEVVFECRVCGRKGPPSSTRRVTERTSLSEQPEGWLHMGRRRDLDVDLYVCGDCRDFIITNS